MADKEIVKAAENEAAKIKDTHKKKDVPAKAGKKKVPLKTRMSTFFRDYKSEIKKIVWPSFKQLVSSTKIVIIAIVIMGIAVGLIDFIFSKGIMLMSSLF